MLGALDENDAQFSGIDAAEIGFERAVCEVGKGAGEFDAGGTAADDCDGHEAVALGGVGGEFCAFEIGEDGAADVLGIGEGFQAEGVGGPGVVAEVSGAGAGGEQEGIEVVGGSGEADGRFCGG